MKGVNKVILVGTLGKDPETRYLNEANVVTKFTLATNRSYKDKQGQKVEETEWHNVEAWGKVAETLTKYLRKGSNLYLEGRIKTDAYEAKDGSGKRYTTKVVLEEFTFLGGGQQNGQGQPQGQHQNTGGAPQYPPQGGAPQYPPQGGAPAPGQVSSQEFINSMPAGGEDDLPF